MFLKTFYLVITQKSKKKLKKLKKKQLVRAATSLKVKLFISDKINIKFMII